jgi:hypothetical protein
VSLAQPVSLHRGAWAALRDGLVEPARTAAAGTRALPLTRLSAAWDDPRADGERVTVWLTPDDATTLAGLLDAHPELAGLLGS